MELEAVEAVAALAVAGSSAGFPSLSMEAAAVVPSRAYVVPIGLAHEQLRRNPFSIFNSQG